ncbi:FAD binding domain-containing protein [Streptomyces sp. NPDC003077]|uniref:FAD binding domain-containing protein n=1 Tax=Streptomyces sp. NPDC003077 TaxID=3154443 RepID=UPI0033A40DA6
MDLNTVTEMVDARQYDGWRAGDAWLAGGTYLFSEPQPHVRRLVDLGRMGWAPLRRTADGGLEIAATCTIAELSGGFRSGFGAGCRAESGQVGSVVERCCRAFVASFKVRNVATVGGNLCLALPAGPMIALTAALDGSCLLYARDGGRRRVAVADFVTGDGRTVLREGELLRSVTLPGRALERRTAFRRASLSDEGRSAALLIGALDPGTGAWTLTITAATVRPVRLSFPGVPGAGELREEIERAVPEGDYVDDVHGLPEWRRHLTFRLGEEIREELAGQA